MKKRILTVVIALILIAIFACYGVLLFIPKPVVQAADDEAFYLFVEDPNHQLKDTMSIISNKQIGIYIHPFEFYGDIVLVYIDSFENNRHTLTGEITLFPIKNGVTYKLCAYVKTLKQLGTPFATITYDTEKPFISAETDREKIENNATMVGKQISVKAHDNLTNVSLFVSKNNSNPQQCQSVVYGITEDGTYTFYAIDVAGNYSDDFTITYYKQEPVKEPDDPIEPDPPITPTNPITPEEPIMDSENTTSQDGGIIAIVVIVSIVIVGIVAVIIYRKIKAKSTHFEDNE